MNETCFAFDGRLALNRPSVKYERKSNEPEKKKVYGIFRKKNVRGVCHCKMLRWWGCFEVARVF